MAPTTRSLTDLDPTCDRTFTSFDGLELVYREGGETDAHPIVFFHGATDTRLTWTQVVPSVESAHRLLLPDARGHGASARAENYHDFQERFVADAITFCSQVVGGPSVLVGHSHGGATAAMVAARRPELVEGLVLLDPPLFGKLPNELVTYLDTLEHVQAITGATEDPLGTTVELLRDAAAFGGEGTMGDVLGEAGLERQAFAWCSVDPALIPAMRSALEHDEFFGFNEKIDCPVRIVQADPTGWMQVFKDEHTERLRTLASDVDIVVAEGLGHTLHLQDPTALARILVEVLAGLGPASRDPSSDSGGTTGPMSNRRR